MKYEGLPCYHITSFIIGINFFKSKAIAMVYFQLKATDLDVKGGELSI